VKFAISSIIVTNYRQYQGTQTLDFSFDKEKNVAVILGKNGAGKSNLLNALTWCFYGVEVHKDQKTQEANGMPIVNTSELTALTPNQNTYAEVLVNIETDIGPWTIKRRIEGGKTALGKIYFDPPKLTVIHPVGGQDKIAEGDETQKLINNLLPEALRNFFFIDGEQLREFFRFSSPKEIATAIDKVSQLELMVKAAENLTMYEKTLRKNVKASTPQLQAVQQQIQMLQEKTEEKKALIQKTEDDISKYNLELDQVAESLRKHNEASVAALQSERDSLEKDKKFFSAQIRNSEAKRNSYLVDIAPFIFLKDEIETAYQLIQYKVDKGELPPRIKENFVRELIERGRCICGNDLTGGAKQELEAYSKKLALSELSDIGIVGKTTIEDILPDIEEFPERINEYNEQIDGFRDQYDQKMRRLELISEELKGHNIDEIRRNEERRDQLTRTIASKSQLLLMYKTDINSLNNTLEQKLDQEKKELSKDKKNALLKTKLQLVQDALKTLGDTEHIVKSKVRNQVEKSTKENFLALIRKKKAFKNIMIDDDYSVKVLQSHGYNVINDLSAGEYMILGLSFMSALMTISGFHAPVIIDTPLGKIDDEHREYITTELPKFLSSTQLILLVTPTEYDENVKENLQKHLLDENFFEIVENESNTTSQVKQHV
jgi:DNA sulfur modification protein DndD